MVAIEEVPAPIVDGNDLIARAEKRRTSVSSARSDASREKHEQYFTPKVIASLMVSMLPPCDSETESLSALDPGAGSGILTAAWVPAILEWTSRPKRIAVTAYEIDRSLLPALRETLDDCEAACHQADIDFCYDLRNVDFISDATPRTGAGFYDHEPEAYDVVIMNPPYAKIRSDSPERATLRTIGVETSNLYTAFLSLAARLVAPNGHLIAITPRSFCNGAYFRSFRRDFLALMSPRGFHTFARRDRSFDGVLQETVITHAVRSSSLPQTVVISSSSGEDNSVYSHEIALSRVVHPRDREMVFHLVEDDAGTQLAAQMAALPATLATLGLIVSTGPIVDFRATEFLRSAPGVCTVPLIWAEHVSAGGISWPKEGSRKP